LFKQRILVAIGAEHGPHTDQNPEDYTHGGMIA
jgi:hypothetical protein